MRQLYIIGSSGHAKVVIDAVEEQGQFKIVGLIDDFKPQGEDVFGYPVLGDIAWLVKQAEQDVINIFIAVGAGFHREAIEGKFSCYQINWPTVIHPKASVSRYASVGNGGFIAANATIAAGAEVAHHVIVNHGSVVDHDVKLSSYVTISPGAILSGNVHIGEGCFIGSNSSVIEKVRIAEHSVVGAGATVLKNVSPLSVTVGTPAKVICSRQKTQSYFGIKNV